MRTTPAFLAAACIALCSVAAHAAPPGDLRELLATDDGVHAPRFELLTDTAARLRLTLLAPGVLRIEATPDGTFRGPGDGAAQIVEQLPDAAVEHHLTDAGDHRLLQTDALSLRIHEHPLRFALYRADNRTLLWEETQPLELGAQATVQTLSSSAGERFLGGGQQNGRFQFKGRELPISYSGGWEEGDRPNPAPFYLSNRGYGVLRNTWSDGAYDFRLAEQTRTAHAENRFDAFYFVGDDIRGVLAEYTALTGRARLLPRWALEYGDADCYNDGDNAKKPGTVPAGWSDGPTGTTPDVIESVARRYREHDMPGGWILPNDGYGCGYTDLPRVVQGLAKHGFHTGLWTENGVERIAWEAGTAGTRAQKLDVAWTGKGYQFSLDANKAAYEGILQSTDARPFVWTVMGWAGTQRYAVTWTGDQSSSWDYVRWHVPTLIGSGLSGQAYASGDVDAIFGGSAETFTRDLQWKSFTPVLMGMSGWSSSARKHPWAYPEPFRSINRAALQLKMRLTPYVYGLAREAEQSGAPPVRGLMWDFPADPAAWEERYANQFLLGSELLVAPVFRSQAASGGWRRGIHLPAGVWYDYRDGRRVTSPAEGRDIDRRVDLQTLPVFVRAGAIIPMYPAMLYDGQKPKDELTLDIYPHGESSYTLYEDDGLTREYQRGAFSEQTIRVRAPSATGDAHGPIEVRIDPHTGRYAGQEPRRRYTLAVHTRARPAAVRLDGSALGAFDNAEALSGAPQGWFYDADDRGGTLFVRTASRDIRDALAFTIEAGAQPMDTRDGDFPAAPDPGPAIPADSLLVVSRPLEEPGQPLENAFDEDPATWFRSTRNQAIRTGPVEWVIGLGERRLVDGIEIAPRTDQHWKYGQVGTFEVYLGDNNGTWGEPVHRGRLTLSEHAQTIRFAPAAGRLLRFRVLSAIDPDGGDSGGDPMVEAAKKARTGGWDATAPSGPEPLAISTFRVLEHRPPEAAAQQLALSSLPLPKDWTRDRPASGADTMQMNGLRYGSGIGTTPGRSVALKLDGEWHTLRADLGIDDSCRGRGALRFQVWGDDRLLYDSGTVEDATVLKPELDVRGLAVLELRTLGVDARPRRGLCGNWANAMLLGYAGDSAAFIRPSASSSVERGQP